MRVHGIAFVGVVTPDVRVLAEFLGRLGLGEGEGEVPLFPLADGDVLAVSPASEGIGDRGAVVGLLVDDVEAAAEEVERAGGELMGPLMTGAGFRYRHFRAPDGSIFELLDRRLPEA